MCSHTGLNRGTTCECRQQCCVLYLTSSGMETREDEREEDRADDRRVRPTVGVDTRPFFLLLGTGVRGRAELPVCLGDFLGGWEEAGVVV